MRLKITLLLSLLVIPLLYTNIFAQQGTFKVNGVANSKTGHYFFSNGTIHASASNVIHGGSMQIKQGKVVAIGKSIKKPKGAIEIDLKGKHVYPSFIDLNSNYGIPKLTKAKTDGPQMTTNTKGAYGWNEAIRAQFNAHENFVKDEKLAKKYQQAGFGAVLTHRHDGIARGTGTLVALGSEKENQSIIKDIASSHLSFSKGTSTQDYPGSLMGCIALLKQTYYDGQWYKTAKYNDEVNISLDAWNENLSLPQFFETNNRLDVLRADKLGDQFGVQYIIKGGGDEYMRINEVKATNAAFIIPINFPKAYDVTDPYDAYLVSLKEMKHWEMAPTNPAVLAKAGVTFAITSGEGKYLGDFIKNLQKAVKYGLSKNDALNALTQTPAKLLGVENLVGTLEKGKLANFIITSDDVFEKDAKIYHNWINGKPYEINDINVPDIRGTYRLTAASLSYELKVSGKLEKPKAEIIKNDTTKIKVSHQLNANNISFSFSDEKNKKTLLFSGKIEGENWKGEYQNTDGNFAKWTAIKIKPFVAKEKKKKDENVLADIGAITYPFTAYGWEETPKTEAYLIKNATVWTNENQGVLENADVFIRNGKIAAVGKNVGGIGAKIIDGSGKHITAGIIDEHSHIAISRGVNEWTEASSAEVSIADVINSEDINIYRQLSGGVTAVQLLHGSANPIGGRSALIKLRWGSVPEKMKIDGADGFIKFALGENVKQSNWGDKTTVRFPQSRMGVEQVFNNHFTRALEYQKNSNPNKRKDVELDVLSEILNSKRFITCHSYVQSEINMLMKVADNFDFTLNTFTHILEGYKVADKMKKHGAGGSTFSDWWAYKYEVIDAIPYNAAILNEMGVVTALNSDDAEMGRRLNQEAAKAVKYGNVSEEDALKMVTLNPAKLLHLDNQTGSIKKGKDADVVLWSDHPLSIYTKAEITWVDGVKYFDLEEDKKMRAKIKAERMRLLQKMIEAKANGEPVKKPKKKEKHHYHCDDVHDEGAEDHEAEHEHIFD